MYIQEKCDTFDDYISFSLTCYDLYWNFNKNKFIRYEDLIGKVIKRPQTKKCNIYYILSHTEKRWNKSEIYRKLTPFCMEFFDFKDVCGSYDRYDLAILFPDRRWDWKKLSEFVPHEVFEKNKHLPWNKNIIVSNHKKKYLCGDNDMYSVTRHYRLSDFNKYPNKNWNWNYIFRYNLDDNKYKNIPWDRRYRLIENWEDFDIYNYEKKIIEKIIPDEYYKLYFCDINAFSKRVKFSYVLRHPGFPWHWDILTSRASYNFIYKHPHLPWVEKFIQ